MMPPVCAHCGHAFDPAAEGALVCFAKRPSDLQWKRRMQERGATGHPPWQAWFCDSHLGAADALTHLHVDEALGRLTAAGVRSA